MSKRLIFFGTEDFSAPSLNSLIEAGYEIVAVVTKPDTPRGRGRTLTSPLVKTIAEQHNIPVLQPARLSDIEAELKSLLPATGVLVSYGKIVPERILNLFTPIGIINLHPSLLPRYRGPSPIEAAIINDDQVTGITIIKLTAGMDEGPIFHQVTVELDGKETKSSLSQRLATQGASQLIEVLPDILSGALQPKPQKKSDVSYTSLLIKQDGFLDPATDDAYGLERKVRAYLGYPKTSLEIDNKRVIITSAKPVAGSEPNELVIPCANESYLLVEELIAPSGRSMSGRDFMRGLKN